MTKPLTETTAPAAPAAEPTYPVTVNGETREMTLAELISAAENALAGEANTARTAGAARSVPNGEIYAAFVQEYPDVSPEEIPPEVWEDAQTEGSLVAAYRKYEITELKARLAALEQNGRNRRQQVGSAKGDGHPAAQDPIAQALLG